MAFGGSETESVPRLESPSVLGAALKRLEGLFRDK